MNEILNSYRYSNFAVDSYERNAPCRNQSSVNSFGMRFPLLEPPTIILTLPAFSNLIDATTILALYAYSRIPTVGYRTHRYYHNTRAARKFAFQQFETTFHRCYHCAIYIYISPHTFDTSTPFLHCTRHVRPHPQSRKCISTPGQAPLHCVLINILQSILLC